jgi:hypothetical protein
MANDRTDIPVLTAEQVRERTQQSPQMPMMYFNYVRVASSFFDVRMFFGQGTINAMNEQSFHEELCVACSLEFAKLLRDNLTVQIDGYTSKWGAIRDVPRLAAPIGTNGATKKKKR